MGPSILSYLPLKSSPHFWKKQPALLYGLMILIGAASILTPSISYIIPLAFLVYSCQSRHLMIIGLSLFALTAIYTKTLYTFPNIGEEKIAGEGIFHTQSITLYASAFQHSYQYKGYLKHFSSFSHTWTHIPCSFHIPLKKERPLGNTDLLIKGYLIQKGDKKYILKPTSFTSQAHTKNSAEWRFRQKQKFTNWVKASIPHKEAGSFLTSMLTGDIDDRLLNLEFNRLGLQHILGVSGFQFVLLAGIGSFLFRLILPYKLAIASLAISLTAYFIFLGDSPPVQRAWISVTIFLVGILLNRRTTPLNALGIGLMVAIIHEPLSTLNIGFQLSFLCTFAILFLYPQLRAWTAYLLPIRSFQDVLKMTGWNRHGYICSALIRETLALNLAVHLMAIPTLLCLFGKFPLLSLFYNLFIPLGATIVFIGSLVAIAFSAIYLPLGLCAHKLNTYLTTLLLDISNNPPAYLEFFIRAPYFPLSMTLAILTLITSYTLDRYCMKKLMIFQK